MRVIERTDNPGQEDKWFVFDFKQAATVPWMVAIPNVIDAFFVCRLDCPRLRGSPLTDFKVAQELLNHGIQFSTLLPVKPLPRSICPVITVPVRLPGYKLTQDDYYAYEQQRATLLSDPRVARSALLRGGIVWRLAVATLSFDDVPSTLLITPNSSPSPPPALPPPLPQELHHQETMASFSTFRQGRTSTLISSSKAFPPPFSQYLRHQEMTSRSPLYQ